ncbi:MAG: ATP synthase subunit I [Rhodospirillaceae bacterium]
MTAASVGALPWGPMALALPYGLAVGTLYFLALRLNARLYLESGPVWRPIALMLGRLFGAVAMLGVLVLWGWPVTLAGLGGFTVARPLVTRWSDRRAAVAAPGREG